MPTIGLDREIPPGAAKVTRITERVHPAARVYQPVALKRIRRGCHREEAYDKCQCDESIKVSQGLRFGESTGVRHRAAPPQQGSIRNLQLFVKTCRPLWLSMERIARRLHS